MHTTDTTQSAKLHSLPDPTTRNGTYPGPADPHFIDRGEGKFHDVLGSQMRIKLTGAETGGQLLVLEDLNRPGVGIPPHVHRREDEVFRVLEGQVEFTVGEVTRVLGPGDVAFAPRNIPHAWRVVGDRVARSLMVATPAGLEGMFAELGALPAGPPDLARVAAICRSYGVEFLIP